MALTFARLTDSGPLQVRLPTGAFRNATAQEISAYNANPAAYNMVDRFGRPVITAPAARPAQGATPTATMSSLAMPQTAPASVADFQARQRAEAEAAIAAANQRSLAEAAAARQALTPRPAPMISAAPAPAAVTSVRPATQIQARPAATSAPIAVPTTTAAPITTTAVPTTTAAPRPTTTAPTTPAPVPLNPITGTFNPYSSTVPVGYTTPLSYATPVSVSIPRLNLGQFWFENPQAASAFNFGAAPATTGAGMMALAPMPAFNWGAPQGPR